MTHYTNDEVHGPFSAEQFSKRLEVSSLGEIDWQIPKNPNFWLPLLGSLMFVAIVIHILAIKFFWITIPVIIGAILLIRYMIKRRKQKTQQLPPPYSSPAAGSESGEA